MGATAELRDGWDAAAREDAMFNILTIPGCEHNGWDRYEFYKTGEDEIAELLERLAEIGLLPRRRERALDFGCGVGRLTTALAAHYKHVDGVDVSGEMIERARPADNVTYTRADDLTGLDGPYDLIYSCITLQHIPQDLQQGYVAEFVRLVGPTGLAVFHLPDRAATFAHPNPWLSMYGTAPDDVARWVAAADGAIVDQEPKELSGGGWPDWRYAVKRKDQHGR